MFVDGNELGKHTPDAATPARPTTPHDPACILGARESGGTKNGSRGGAEYRDAAASCREPLSTGLTGMLEGVLVNAAPKIISTLFTTGIYSSSQRATRDGGKCTRNQKRHILRGPRSLVLLVPSMAGSPLNVARHPGVKGCLSADDGDICPPIQSPAAPGKENPIVALLRAFERGSHAPEQPTLVLAFRSEQNVFLSVSPSPQPQSESQG